MIADICVRPWEFAVEPFRIAGNLYYVGNTNVSSHLVDTGDGLILLDTAFPQAVYLLLESVRRLGFDPDDIGYVLHTHAHYDHFGGTRAIVELTGAPTALGADDIEILEEQPELTWAAEYGTEFHEAFEVDLPLRDGDVVTLGDTRIECMSIPGHTPGAMSYFFDVVEEGRTFSVGLHGGPGRNTLTDEYMALHGLPASRRSDYLNSLERMRGRSPDIQIGAHPDQAQTFAKRDARTDDHNPFVDPGSWPAFLDQLERRAVQEWRTA